MLLFRIKVGIRLDFNGDGDANDDDEIDANDGGDNDI